MDIVNAETLEENICIQRAIYSKGTILEHRVFLLLSYKIDYFPLGLKDEAIFVGLKKTPPANYSQWSNGQDLTYTDWADGNPSSYSTEHCVIY